MTPPYVLSDDRLLSYARQGWRLYPSRYVDGQHIGLVPWSTEATSDPETILAWRKRWPEAYYCVALRQSGMAVVDIDNKHGKSGAARLLEIELNEGNALPPTLTAATPSGGMHYFFQGAVKTKPNSIAPGIDTPVMVPIPGQIVPGKGEYRIVKDAPVARTPRWVAKKAGAPDAAGPGDRSAKPPAIDWDLPHHVDRASTIAKLVPVAVEGDGGDLQTYRVACQIRDLAISEPMCLDILMRHFNPRCEPPWDPEELELKIRNAYRYGRATPGQDTPETDFDVVPTPFETPAEITPDTIGEIIMPAEQFVQLDVPPRRSYLHPWVREDAIILVSGYRGIGKSWFTMGALDAITKGIQWGPWKATEPTPCMYLDGEMPVSDVIDRQKLLNGDGKERRAPLYIYSDAWANRKEKPRANLNNPAWRRGIMGWMERRGIRVWVADNLASLAPGLDENSRQDWDPINQWLLELRFHGITTILVHHVGKTGDQRGTSAREDNLDVAVVLSPVKGGAGPGDDFATRFAYRFSKSRVGHKEKALIAPGLMSLMTHNGRCDWSADSGLVDLRQAQILQMLDEGRTQAEIAESLGVSRQYVSKLKKEAIESGLFGASGAATTDFKRFDVLN